MALVASPQSYYNSGIFYHLYGFSARQQHLPPLSRKIRDKGVFCCHFEAINGKIYTVRARRQLQNTLYKTLYAMIKVLIIDDHAVMRLGIRSALEMDGEIEIAGELASGEGAVEFVREHKPDIVLLDIYMPGKNGLEVLREILAAQPDQKVLILTTSSADNDAYTALQEGAKGYLLKDLDADNIYQAIKTVSSGGTFVPSAVQKLLDEHASSPALTEREIEILRFMAKGLSNDGIAEVLDISANTIKNHVKAIFKKMDVSERVSAVNEARRRGFVRD